MFHFIPLTEPDRLTINSKKVITETWEEIKFRRHGEGFKGICYFYIVSCNPEPTKAKSGEG